MSMDDAKLLDDRDRAVGHAQHQHGIAKLKAGKLWRWCRPEDLVGGLPERVDVCSGPVTLEELAGWKELGMLPPGDGGRTKTVRVLEDCHIPNVIFDMHDFERLQRSNVSNWMPNWDWIPRPLSEGKQYMLILFSGRRRHEDIASWVTWTSSITPICIDTAVDSVHGNMFHIELWIDLIRSRRVIGCHAAPPCETYSLARWLRMEGEKDGTGPRPLRNSSFQWCLPERTWREVRQAACGSILMFRAIFLVTLTFLHGGAFTVEHPRGVSEEDMGPHWCIWNAAMTHFLRLAPGVQLVQFLQGPLGKSYAKPTCILQGNLPFLAMQIYNNYAANWRPTVVLGGKDSSGHWKTMEAKEYPPLLSQILASQFVQYGLKCKTSGHEELPERLHQAVEALSHTWDPYEIEGCAQMLQDYQPHLAD